MTSWVSIKKIMAGVAVLLVTQSLCVASEFDVLEKSVFRTGVGEDITPWISKEAWEEGVKDYLNKSEAMYSEEMEKQRKVLRQQRAQDMVEVREDSKSREIMARFLGIVCVVWGIYFGIGTGDFEGFGLGCMAGLWLMVLDAPIKYSKKIKRGGYLTDLKEFIVHKIESDLYQNGYFPLKEAGYVAKANRRMRRIGIPAEYQEKAPFRMNDYISQQVDDLVERLLKKSPHVQELGPLKEEIL